MNRVSPEQKAKIIIFFLFVCLLLLFLFGAAETNIWQTLHLEIMCSSCHLWLCSLFIPVKRCLYRHPADSSLLLTTMKAKLLYSPFIFLHTWVRGSCFFLKYNTCQKKPHQLRSCTNDAVRGVCEPSSWCHTLLLFSGLWSFVCVCVCVCVCALCSYLADAPPPSS